MSRILAPHKEQDGWVYVRVSRRRGAWFGRPMPKGDQRYPVGKPLGTATGPGIAAFYHDTASGSRVISSRRVEEAVETADYLKRCAEEGLEAMQFPSGHWYVQHTSIDKHPVYASDDESSSGDTLREAYYRYHAKDSR